MRRSWIALGVGGALVLTLALAPALRRSLRAEVPQGDAPALAKATPVPAAAIAPPASALAGLDLTKIRLADAVATAPLPGNKTARLTIDPALQRTTHAVMAMHHIPEAAVVLMEVATGKVLVYATHIEKGPARDLCAEASAPAASVFKVVTSTALVETAGLTPDQRECYSGGEQRIHSQDLVPDPKRDRWCTTLAGALGRSVNTVFARLALRHLPAPALEATARGLGFGSPLPFDVDVQPSALKLPEEPLDYARTAAGFWNTTLSPVHAAWLGATVARGGEPIRPSVVADVVDEAGRVAWTAPGPLAQKRAMKPETAQAVTTMMEATVNEGTGYRAFHDRGGAFLPGIPVAGKTGTLTDAAAQRFYTWFAGFAPSHAVASEDKDATAPPQVAFGVLVVNGPTWNVKANVLAREVLRAYYAGQKVPGVSPPQLRVAKEKPNKKRGKRR